MSNQFFITHTGERVYIKDLPKLKINLEDIAHHLASPKNQRFGGALDYKYNYTVAQHSILMAMYANERLNKDVARACLLHDATEAYFGDVVSPLKRELPDYLKLESELSDIIYKKYNINTSEEVLAMVELLDKSIVLDEVKSLLPNQFELFSERAPTFKPLGIEVDGTIPPQEVKDAFLRLAEYFNIRD
jgi:hypothetical protein